jgi:hypothetical protein
MVGPMTADQFRAAIANLGLSQVSAAKFLGISVRTSHSYASPKGRIPEPVAKLLQLALKMDELDPVDLDRLLASHGRRRRA